MLKIMNKNCYLAEVIKKTMRPLVRTKTTAIYRVTQNITTEEKKDGRDIYFLYSFFIKGGHKIFGQEPPKKCIMLPKIWTVC